MLNDVIASLISFFLITPLQNEIQTRLPEMPSVEVTSQMSACAAELKVVLVDRAMGDPVWAIKTSAFVLIGWTDPVTLVGPGEPACSGLLKMAGLKGQGQNI